MALHECGARRKLSDRYDAYFCPACDVWLEVKCGTRCDACRGRPDRPSEDPETLASQAPDC